MHPAPLRLGNFGRFGELISTVPQGAVVLAAVALAGLAIGLITNRLGAGSQANWIWTAASIPVLGTLLFQIGRALPRGDIGLDVLAALSMATAIVLGEPLPANVVALMYAGGQLLERYAEGRARREMTSLLRRAPVTAMRYHDSALNEVPIGSVNVGDRLLVRQGDVIPVDGTVAGGAAKVDESALTGEPLPVSHAAGEEVLSGSVLVGPAIDLIVRSSAAESTLAGIIRLVEGAQRNKAPMVRLADRYAAGFLVLSLTLAGLAWFASGDPQRFLAVLVLATPCPLILAVPVAVISGMSNAARFGALFKDGGAFEKLAEVATVLLDKTGTLTYGEARVRSITSLGEIEEKELLRLAASLDQASSHVVAHALVVEARRRDLVLTPPRSVVEAPGAGIEGLVGDVPVVVGALAYVRDRCMPPGADVPDPANAMHGLTVAVGAHGQLSGVIILADEVRPDAARMLTELRAAGISRIGLVSGDKCEVAQAVGGALGLDAILCELSPAAKVSAVAAERRRGIVMMVGDGVNDAPALAAADVGVAMGARGAAASAEAASVVVLVDRLDPLTKAVAISKRARRIALQSVFVGLGLSIAGMIAAAMGLVAPVWGAILQEGIDVAVILNALRALR